MSGLFGKLLFLAILAAGGAVIYFGVYEVMSRHQELARGHPSSDWPSTEGRVTHSIIARGGETSGLHFRYDFTVEGRDYTGERVSFGSVRGRRVVEEYPQGAEVTVYYDPANPGESVLEPGLPLTSYLLNQAIPAAAVLVGLVVVVLAVRLPLRAPERT